MSRDFNRWIKENIGSCLSWAITFAWLIFIYFKIHNGILPSNLNEFGDFIAGAFAPLAFFWLVRGFYQQGKGLEQNSEALKMQAKELNLSSQALLDQVKEMQASVAQQSRLAEVYEQELQQKHFQVQPYLEFSFKLIGNFTHDEPICDEEGFVIDHYEDRVIQFNLTIKNIGETARNLFIKNRSGQLHLAKRKYKLEHLEALTINFEVDSQIAYELNSGDQDLIRTFRISYQDIYGKEYEQYLACDVYANVNDETGEIYLEERFRIISKDNAFARPI